MNVLRIINCVFCLMLINNISAFSQQYQLGHKQVTYQDPARNNRSIQTEIYYPAITAGENVPVAEGQFPIIVFGHGFVMAWSAYQNFWDSIVPGGYIMAFPRTEGSISPNHSEFGLDLAFLVDKIKTEGTLSTSFLYQKVAATSAISGHSMGGGASFLAAENNMQITTMIVFAPANTNPSSITAAQNITVPSVIFYGENDGVAPPTDHQIPMYDSLSSDCKTRIGIIGGGHCYFANSNFNCSFGEGTTSPQPTITREEQQATVLYLLKPYLEYILKGDTASGNLFLNRLNSFSSVTYQKSCSTTSIENRIIDVSDIIIISPNPLKNKINFSCNNSAYIDEIFEICIMNMTGKVIFAKSQKLNFQNSIDAGQFAKGIYMMRIKNKKFQMFEKLILQ